MEVRAARTAKKKARNEARAEAAREAQKLRRKTALDAVMAEFGRGKSAQDLVVEAQTLNEAFDVATISTADGSSASSPQASPEPNTVSGGQLEWDPVHKSWRIKGPASGASTSSPSPLDAATWALKRASAGPRVETSTVIGSSQEVTAQPQQAASRPRLEWDAVHGAWKLAGGAGEATPPQAGASAASALVAAASPVAAAPAALVAIPASITSAVLATPVALSPTMIVSENTADAVAATPPAPLAAFNPFAAFAARFSIGV